MLKPMGEFVFGSPIDYKWPKSQTFFKKANSYLMYIRERFRVHFFSEIAFASVSFPCCNTKFKLILLSQFCLCVLCTGNLWSTIKHGKKMLQILNLA